jgi:choice-of-anchor B domain-containing protein
MTFGKRLFTLAALFIMISSCGLNMEIDDFPHAVNPAQFPCLDGLANDLYPCSNIDLMAHIPVDELLTDCIGGGPSQSCLNDIWGWIDPQTGSEYALIGLVDGVTFVDITNPADPVVIGILPGTVELGQNITTAPPVQNHDDGGFKEAGSWRDIKVYENFMYVVSDERNHGMQIFDLHRLRTNAELPVEFTPDALYSRFENSHNININEESGFLYVVGNLYGEICATNGGLHIIDINNPLIPVFAGCYVDEEGGGRTRPGYIHDTQCVIYDGPDTRFTGNEICFNSSEYRFSIADVSDKTTPVTISMNSYPGNAYSHQGWLTDDHAYFFMNDELDELSTHNPTRTYIWDLSDLEEPEMIGFYPHTTNAIDHNLYIIGNLMYQANYTAGIRILDISNPTPQGVNELGFFNTTPNNNARQFAGVWSVYPWLTNNVLITGDIRNGLFILRYNPE